MHIWEAQKKDIRLDLEHWPLSGTLLTYSKRKYSLWPSCQPLTKVVWFIHGNQEFLQKEDLMRIIMRKGPVAESKIQTIYPNAGPRNCFPRQQHRPALPGYTNFTRPVMLLSLYEQWRNLTVTFCAEQCWRGPGLTTPATDRGVILESLL